MYRVIRNRFEKAAKHYDENAVAQKSICEKLFSLIPQLDKVAPDILELGCGTGNFSKMLLNLTPHKLILNDICGEYSTMLTDKIGSIEYQFICKDAVEHVNEAKESGETFDIIASASTIQWLNKPIEFLINCKEILNKNGILAVSTFAPGNLDEVTSITRRGLQYPSTRDYALLLEPHYHIIDVISEEIKVIFDSPMDILVHMKLTGVTGTSTKNWTKSDTDHFVNEYNKIYRDKNGNSPLTYRPMYIICKKK